MISDLFLFQRISISKKHVNPNLQKQRYTTVGSLIASTLDITDTDFLQENYSFLLENVNSEIRNEGALESIEGSIVLLSSKIQNLGSITAKAGTALLASGEHVTLDFTGDGLIQFSVEGSLKESLIEHLGDITASVVQLKIPAAKKAISGIVNLEGVEEADIFVEENGVIKFASIASIESQKVLLEAASLEIEGFIDATSLESMGGEVHLLGKDIILEGAVVNASGALGGGEVLIGGEYQGQGETPWASKVIMDESSLITSNALDSGDGGLVVLWSQDQTLFNGKVEAKGGAQGGNGGLVESSSQGDLGVLTAFVDTTARAGKIGEWLLDPYGIVIVDGYTGECTDPCICTLETFGFCFMDPGIFNRATTAITLTAVQIGIYSNITSSVNVTFKGCPSCTAEDSICDLLFNITTNGTNLSFVDTRVQVNGAPIIKTNNGNVSIPSMTNNPLYADTSHLTIDAGSGDVSIDMATGFDVIKEIDITASLVTTSGLETNGVGGITLNDTSTLASNSSSLSIITHSGPINLGSISLSGTDLTLNAGASGNVTISGTTTVASLAVTSDSLIIGTIFASPGDIDISTPMSLSENSTFSSTGGNVTFSSTIEPTTTGISIVFLSSTGTVTLPSFDSNENLFDNLTITADSIVLASGISVDGNMVINNSSPFTVSAGALSAGGDFSQTGSGAITLESNISVGDEMSFAGQVTVTASTELSAPGGLEFSSSILAGAAGLSLTLNDGSSTLTVPVIGSSATPFDSVALIGNAVNLSSVIKTRSLSVDNSGVFTIDTLPISLTGSFEQIGTSTVSLSENITANSVSLASNLLLKVDGITITATDSIVFGGDVTSSGSFTLIGASVAFDQMSSSGGSILVSAPATATGTGSKVLSTGGDITFSSTIMPESATPNLTIDAGTSDVTTGVLGTADNPFNNITVVGCDIAVEDYYADGTVNIDNCEALIMPARAFSVGGNFVQSGVGPVSLAYNITAGNVLYFTGPVTIIEDFLTLIGNEGIDFEGPILAGADDLSLALTAPSSLVILHSIGTPFRHFEKITITGDSLILNGPILTNSLQLNGNVVTKPTPPNVSLLYTTVPKNLFYVPGLYSSWETFFNEEYYQTSPANFSNE